MSNYFEIDYVIELDDEGDCAHCDREGAVNQVQAYMDAEGGRRMETCCRDCLLQIVETYALPGLVKLETTAANHRAIMAALYRSDVEPADAAATRRTDAALLAKAFGW